MIGNRAKRSQGGNRTKEEEREARRRRGDRSLSKEEKHMFHRSRRVVQTERVAQGRVRMGRYGFVNTAH